jgi:hypothetical protein
MIFAKAVRVMLEVEAHCGTDQKPYHALAYAIAPMRRMGSDTPAEVALSFSGSFGILVLA